MMHQSPRRLSYVLPLCAAVFQFTWELNRVGVLVLCLSLLVSVIATPAAGGTASRLRRALLSFERVITGKFKHFILETRRNTKHSFRMRGIGAAVGAAKARKKKKERERQQLREQEQRRQQQQEQQRHAEESSGIAASDSGSWNCPTCTYLNASVPLMSV